MTSQHNCKSSRIAIAIGTIVLLVIASLLILCKCQSNLKCCEVYMYIALVALAIVAILFICFANCCQVGCDDSVIEFLTAVLNQKDKENERSHELEMFKLRSVQSLLDNHFKNKHEYKMMGIEKDVIKYHLAEKIVEEICKTQPKNHNAEFMKFITLCGFNQIIDNKLL